MARFNGKVALVTGAASGIGRATAALLHAEGARLGLADINQEKLDTVAAELGGGALPLGLDVTVEAHWREQIAALIERFGKLDIVCNIAGFGIPGTIEDIEVADFEKMVAVNLTGTVLGCKHGVRAIRETDGAGAIINVSSIGGLVGGADVAGYCATKGGVTTLTKSVALHCAEQRLPIRCVSIHPTFVDSEMLDPIADAFQDREAMLNFMRSQVPMHRVATVNDVARSIAFAASDDAAMISGSALVLDGAQLAGPPSAHSG